MLNIFEFSRVRENGASWLVYANKLFELPKIAPYFSKDIIKQSLCQLVFFTFQTFSQKNKVTYKVTVLTVIISLYLSKTKKKKTVLFTLLLQNIVE